MLIYTAQFYVSDSNFMHKKKNTKQTNTRQMCQEIKHLIYKFSDHIQRRWSEKGRSLHLDESVRSSGICDEVVLSESNLWSVEGKQATKVNFF